MVTPICTDMHTKRAKSDAIIFKSQIGVMPLDCKFIPGQALPLGSTRFFRLAHISPVIQRRPARRSCDGRSQSCKADGKMSCRAVAPWPGSDRAMAEQLPPDDWRDGSRDNRLVDANQPGSDRAASGKITRESVRHRPGRNRGTHSKQQLASGLPGFSPFAFSHCIQNYDHINHTTNHTRY